LRSATAGRVVPFRRWCNSISDLLRIKLLAASLDSSRHRREGHGRGLPSECQTHSPAELLGVRPRGAAPNIAYLHRSWGPTCARGSRRGAPGEPQAVRSACGRTKCRSRTERVEHCGETRTQIKHGQDLFRRTVIPESRQNAAAAAVPEIAITADPVFQNLCERRARGGARGGLAKALNSVRAASAF
jgi:hypothetical protein